MISRPRTLQPTLVAFGALGSLLVITLTLPVITLLTKIEVAPWLSALQDPRAIDALTLSLWTSLVSVALMSLVGVPLGYVLARAHFPGRQLLICAIVLPTVVPGLAGGILLLQAFGPMGVAGRPLAQLGLELFSNPAGVVLAQLYVASPFVVITSMVAFSGIDRQLESAAATLGDAPWMVFRRVSLPLAWPTIAAGLVLAWVRALGEFGATMIVAYNPQTLPVHLWVRFQAGGLDGALPLAFLLVCLATAATAGWRLLGGTGTGIAVRDDHAVERR